MTTEAKYVLEVIREFDAPCEKIFRAWTEPELLKQWFTPRPWTVSLAELDLRPGGASLVVMRGPNGEEFPNRGVYLEIIPNEKIVVTDAYVSAWVPSEKPFMTAIVLLEDIGGGRTRYTWQALHWTAEDMETHEKMGFHEGWGKAADQLAELVSGI
ncbi:polyketide cyclase [Neorhizobium sp. P12A]|uniref:SRPBCC family protein n=1 Tax=Neorhizobium sp. P12A TaxID=2268027 RepID=UPI0011EF0D33|nr:SRPBCC family protein [Neorhizobium sp. P12A]KAA0700569.1 polyketide cyclase [Neorhizobium sp. P12A]